MASSKFSYQKLKKLPSTTDDQQYYQVEDHQFVEESLTVKKNVVVNLNRSRSRSSSRSSWLRLRKSRRWRRPRVRIAGLRRLVRRKAKVVRSALRRVVKRIKDGSPYIGDLFAGNYMFMQVTPSLTGPTPTKSFLPPAAGPHFYAAAAAAASSNSFNLPRVVS